MNAFMNKIDKHNRENKWERLYMFPLGILTLFGMEYFIIHIVVPWDDLGDGSA